jgi:hypothetical protein
MGAVAAALGGASGSLAASEIAVDCGAGADLQAAINAAPKGAILDISGTCGGSFTVGKNLVLRGVSNGVLDAQGRDGTLTVTKGHVRLSRLVVTGAADHDGLGTGGIHNAGTLTLFRVTVTGNLNQNGVAGIYNSGALTIQRSNVSRNDGGASDAGGIVSSGSLTIEKSTISDNEGTGISSTSLTLIDSTVSGNDESLDGGGIYASGTTTIIRSTIANNHAFNGEAGGIYGGPLTIIDSTIVGNQGDDVTGGIETGSALITGTIIAGNQVAHQFAADCAGTLQSNGYNFIGTTFFDAFGNVNQTCNVNARSTDQVGGQTPIDPLLNPLASYGGPTQTALPKPGSPVVNKIAVGATSADGTISLCPSSGTTDQRGIPRPQAGSCDIGSVERKPKE